MAPLSSAPTLHEDLESPPQSKRAKISDLLAPPPTHTISGRNTTVQECGASTSSGEGGEAAERGGALP